VGYRSFVTAPVIEVDRIADFIGVPMDRAAMVRAVDPSLYRNKA
jgi:hypothetical protein